MFHKINKPIIFLVLFFLFAVGCATVHYRENIIDEIKQAELKLLKAENIEAPVYAPELFLEARLDLKRANELFSAENYKDSKAAVQRSKKLSVMAYEETLNERRRINDLVERLLYRGTQLWNGYEEGEGKFYAPAALLEIKNCLDEGYKLLSEGYLSEALKTAQKAHRLLVLIPDFIQRGKIDNLEAEDGTLTAEEMVNEAKKEAAGIIDEARKEAVLIAEEQAEKALEMRMEEFERIYPSKYVVKEGETLIDISARKEIFNDPYMWLLIYRSNRDQIRDPQFIYPGQKLSIPRNISYEDIIEARKQAAAPEPYDPPAHAYSPEFYKKYMMIEIEDNKEKE